MEKNNASEQDFKLIRMIWVDASGQSRCRAVPEKKFHDSVKKTGVSLAKAVMAMPSFTDGPASETGLSAVGEMCLLPDLSTMRTIPWAKQDEMVLADMHLKPGIAWDYCPREALRKVCKILKTEFNLEVNAGFEMEFLLLKSEKWKRKEEWVPVDQTPYCSTGGFDAVSPVLREMAAGLQSLNIGIEQIHSEGGKGQFEFSLRYTTAITAADNLAYAREVIRAVARKHGLLATFVPKYVLDEIGSGAHVHISLAKNGKNVYMASGSRYGISKIGEEFMAGVLAHLPSILAFTAPVPNSYDRIQPNMWSGAFQCWGKENKEAAIRTASPPDVSDDLVSNFELKACDGCANPFLGLASIIAAGIDGLRKHLDLPDPISVNPSELGVPRLPGSLSESVEALSKDNVLKDLIGEKLVTAITGVRKAEIKFYANNKDAYKSLIHKY